VLQIRIGFRCLFDPWIRDPGSGIGKTSRSGSGMNIPYHISESLATFFWVKILEFFEADPDGKIKVRDKHPGSATLE
jgi:hypothetical protein